MRFQGDIAENLNNALVSKDDELARDILVDEIVNLIEKSPKELIKALRFSNVKVSDTASKKDLADIASYNIYNNPLFQKNLAVIFSFKGTNEAPSESDYASADAGGIAGGASEASKGGGNLVGSIADMIGSIGKWGSSSNELKAEEERTKQKMYEKMFGRQKKTNWMPIVVIAGVLIIGGIVVWRVTAKK